MDRRRFTIARLLWAIAMAAVILGYFREPMEVALLSIAVAYAAVLVHPWVTVALDLKRSAWSSADARYQPLNSQAGDCPTWIVQIIGEAVPQLEELGFQALGHFGLDGTVPNCVAVHEPRVTSV